MSRSVLDADAESIARARRRWISASNDGGKFWSECATWTQSTTTVEVTIALPIGTRGRDVRMTIEPTSVRLWTTFGGECAAFAGPLARRCKPSESAWSLDDGELFLVLAKDDGGRDGTPWQSVILGVGTKSVVNVLRDMVAADEPYVASDELDSGTQSLVEQMRARHGMLASGTLLNPEDDLDFRLGVSLSDV